MRPSLDVVAGQANVDSAEFLAKPLIRQMSLAIMLALLVLRVLPPTRELAQWVPTVVGVAYATAGLVLVFHLWRRPAAGLDFMGRITDRRSWWLATVTIPLVCLSLGGAALVRRALPFPEAATSPTVSPLFSSGPDVASWGGWCMGAIVLIAVVPVIEEVLFRVVVYRRSLRRWGPVRGAIVTSVIFAMLHGEWLSTFLVSLAMIVLLRRSGSLWLPIVCHGVGNALMVGLTLRPGVEPSITDFALTRMPSVPAGAASTLFTVGLIGTVLFWYFGLGATSIGTLLRNTRTCDSPLTMNVPETTSSMR